ncbi:hypothetical protein [Spirosoma sordidisoli]|uniref:Uncharacterized protein n=1 Tax=Spirosoma sordidisoli TaxID=2502893 RepID=A0A4Q2UMW5_9BACT|nr:hypothetical protein [Spirosoma sordidisoli]RYC70744.1 hypothetical protein EQG79_00900 [Spirosoma sordidisoli]
MLKRTLAYEVDNGDIWVIVGLIYPSPSGIRPVATDVIMERTRDGKRIERAVDVVEEQIRLKKLVPRPVFNDKRDTVRIDICNNQLILETI